MDGVRFWSKYVELNISLQAAEVPFVCMSYISSRSLAGIGEGDCSIAQAFERKEESLSRNKASASLLWAPDM